MKNVCELVHVGLWGGGLEINVEILVLVSYGCYAVKLLIVEIKKL